MLVGVARAGYQVACRTPGDLMLRDGGMRCSSVAQAPGKPLALIRAQVSPRVRASWLVLAIQAIDNREGFFLEFKQIVFDTQLLAQTLIFLLHAFKFPGLRCHRRLSTGSSINKCFLTVFSKSLTPGRDLAGLDVLAAAQGR
jgi:hypothetical protein